MVMARLGAERRGEIMLAAKNASGMLFHSGELSGSVHGTDKSRITELRIEESVTLDEHPSRGGSTALTLFVQ